MGVVLKGSVLRIWVFFLIAGIVGGVYERRCSRFISKIIKLEKERILDF